MTGRPELEAGTIASPATAAAGPARVASELRCLWIARELPFPMTTGDRIYTAMLARSFGDAGVDLTFVGLEAAFEKDVPQGWPVKWVPVPGRKRPNWRALLSWQPLVSAAFALATFQRRLADLLLKSWDVIVIDHYGCAFALDAVLRAARSRTPRSLVVHISQNHEEALAKSLFRSYSGGLFNRLILYQNFLKIRHWERRLTREVDLVAAITDEDRIQFDSAAANVAKIVLTPGYLGPHAPARTISATCARRVVIVGSYRWLVKQENLRQLLKAADARFHAAGIVLDVIGDVPEELLGAVRPQLRATRFHGFVDDVGPYFAAARMALVPEVIGGGFKLKFLDYIFGRVPVATISAAAAGLPEGVRKYVSSAPTLEALVDRVIEEIDDLDHLNRLQDGAYREAEPLFDWRDRGRALKRSALAILAARAPAPGAASAAAERPPQPPGEHSVP